MEYMGKPLNWMLSGSPVKRATSRLLRSRLAATTILAVVPFLGYGRQAYAVCVETPPASSQFICSGTFAGQSITADNADVETAAAPPMVVTSTGLQISGDGAISFTDNYASSITNLDGHGLEITADDALEPPPIGSIDVFLDGTDITGTEGSGVYT